MLKCDLHIHTTASDGIIPADILAYKIKEKSLDVVGLTDHNTFPRNTYMDKLRRLLEDKCKIILGVEISTNLGHILILGVTKRDKKLLNKKDAIEVVEYAKDQNYLIVAPHPFDIFRKGIGFMVNRVSIDAIECMNGRSLTFLNILAYHYAKKLHVGKVAGSDAHTPQEIGTAYFFTATEPTVEHIIEHIRKGKTTIPLKEYLLSKRTIMPLSRIIYGFALKHTHKGKILLYTGKIAWILIGRYMTKRPFIQILRLHNITNFLLREKLKIIGTRDNMYVVAGDKPIINVYISHQKDTKKIYLVEVYVNKNLAGELKHPLQNALKTIIYTKNRDIT